MPVTEVEVPKRIVLKGEPRQDEGIAGGAITPGMAATLNGDAEKEFDTVGADNGSNALVIALEDALQGKTISDAYAADDRFFYAIPQRGDEFYLYLAASQTITVGMGLVPTNGVFAEVGTSDTAVAEAMSAVTTAGAVGRVKARWL